MKLMLSVRIVSRYITLPPPYSRDRQWYSHEIIHFLASRDNGVKWGEDLFWPLKDYHTLEYVSQTICEFLLMFTAAKNFDAHTVSVVVLSFRKNLPIETSFPWSLLALLQIFRHKQIPAYHDMQLSEF